jgi:hypothetical protein
MGKATHRKTETVQRAPKRAVVIKYADGTTVEYATAPIIEIFPDHMRISKQVRAKAEPEPKGKASAKKAPRVITSSPSVARH